jgi:hypothetical protein
VLSQTLLNNTYSLVNDTAIGRITGLRGRGILNSAKINRLSVT